MKLDFLFEGAAGAFRFAYRFDGEVAGLTGILGPSGAGKTTLLRLLAGLDRPASGHLRVDDEALCGGRQWVPAERRGLVWVGQRAPTFAHWTVAQHLRYAGWRGPGHGPRVADTALLDRLGLAALAHRRPAGLSGGERQRLALATALAARPRMLLLDEPVSALDVAARESVLAYLAERAHASEMPILMVTHGLAELARQASGAWVVEDGQLTHAAGLEDLATDPLLAARVGEEVGALLRGAHRGRTDDGLLRLDVAGAEFLTTPRSERVPEGPATLWVRARDVSLAREADGAGSILNVVPVVVRGVREAGPAEVLVDLALGTAEGPRLVSRISRRSATRLEVRPGARLHARVKAVSLDP